MSSVYLHPEYNAEEEEMNNFDIALLKLTMPVTITDYVRTACVPTPDMMFEIGTMCAATGWGADSNAGMMPYQSPIMIVSRELFTKSLWYFAYFY